MGPEIEGKRKGGNSLAEGVWVGEGNGEMEVVESEGGGGVDRYSN